MQTGTPWEQADDSIAPLYQSPAGSGFGGWPV